jgi:hypothetical protein
MVLMQMPRQKVPSHNTATIFCRKGLENNKKLRLLAVSLSIGVHPWLDLNWFPLSCLLPMRLIRKCCPRYSRSEILVKYGKPNNSDFLRYVVDFYLRCVELFRCITVGIVRNAKRGCFFTLSTW